MSRLMRAVLTGSLALMAIAESTSVRAQSWGEPNRAFARYGVRAIACDESTHDAPCLAIACRGGALVMVSAAGGGGPMDGPTRVSTGRNVFSASFKYDEDAINKLGVAASEVDLTASQFDMMLTATSLTLSPQSDPSIRHKIPTRGLTASWNRAFKSCE